MTAMMVHVVLATAAAAAVASDAATTATSRAYPEYHRRHRPMTLFSNDFIPKQHRKPLADSWVRRRKYLIRPSPGWHPCAELHIDSNGSNSNISTVEGDHGDIGSRSSSTAVVVAADDVANIIVDDNKRIKNIIGGDQNNDTIIANKNNTDETQKQQLGAILILLTVPAAWGTYAPAVKYIYDVAPDGSTQPSMPGLVFSAGYYCVAALTLGILSFWKDQQTEDADDIMEGSSQRTRIVQEERVEEKEIEVEYRVGKMHQHSQSNQSRTQSKEDENEVSSRGGWELGSYLFIGNALQVAGLQTVPADRAGECSI
jgi:hypothetical protein